MSAAALDLATEAPAPRYAPTRNPAMATDGGKVALIAEAIGTPLLPWQRFVADIATEYDPATVNPVTGRPTRWRYRTVVITVPRQCGKSVLMRAVFVARAFLTPGHQIFHTAQMGKDANDLWNDTVEAVLASRLLRSRVKVRKSVGSQRLEFIDTRSRISPFAPTPKGMHGKSPHLVGIDEAWAFDQVESDALMAAVDPAMQTKPDRQKWIVSTAGDARSAFLRDLVERGRAGTDPELAYFEWSADPAADPMDPATWTFHPGRGHLITDEDLAGYANGPRGVFLRGFMNLATQSRESVLPLDVWDDMAGEQIPPATSDLALAYDIDADRRAASIWAGWRDRTGRVNLRCVMYGHGSTWLVPTVRELARSWRPRVVGADDGGPARQATDELRLAGVEVETLGARDFATATGTLIGYTDPDNAGELMHDGSPALHHALENATTRPMGQAVAWDRNRSLSGISPAIAATVAARLADFAPPPAPAPFISV